MQKKFMQVLSCWNTLLVTSWVYVPKLQLSHLVQNKLFDASWTKSYVLHQQLWQPFMKPGMIHFHQKSHLAGKGFLVSNHPCCQLTLVSFFWGRDSLSVWSITNWFIQGWFGVSCLFQAVVLTEFVLLVLGLFLLPPAQHSTLHLCGSSVLCHLPSFGL